MSRPNLPRRTRVYQNHHLDSTRWDRIDRRAGDIIITTPYKCGTTWTQTIVLHLIFQDLQPRELGEFSPWVDFRPPPIDDLVAKLAAQTHRRCLKSHLPADGTAFDPEAQYLVIGRDPRDVFMSFWNHYSNYTEMALAQLAGGENLVGAPLPPCDGDIRQGFRDWISRGWFAWENEGYPFWGNMAHIRSWWAFRDLPNIRFVHFNDLLADTCAEIAGIAAYLNIACSSEMCRDIAKAVSFKSMRRAATQISTGNEAVFKDGARTFINKGTNGRWKDVLTGDDLTLYDQVAARELPPDCRDWLEGRAAAV